MNDTMNDAMEEESVKVEAGVERTTVCKHEWAFVGMNNDMYDYQCKKCWSGMQRGTKWIK